MLCLISIFQKVHLHLLDLSKPRDVIQFAEGFVQSQQPLDVLVNESLYIYLLLSDCSVGEQCWMHES